MKTAIQRYQEDPLFHALVELLLVELAKGEFTPSELREAVILAATIHETERLPDPLFLTRGEARTLGIGPTDDGRLRR